MPGNALIHGITSKTQGVGLNKTYTKIPSAKEIILNAI